MDRSPVRRAPGDMAFLAICDLRQRAVLPAAPSRPRRDAAPNSGLSHAVLRLEHGLFHRWVRVRRVADSVRVCHLEVCPRGAARGRPDMGWRTRARMGAVFTAPSPLVAESAS